MVNVRSLALPEVREIVPQKLGDERGWFAEAYKMRRFAEAGIGCEWVQDNQSYSASAYTLRGLHYQEPPFAQDKLVRVLRGKILDVAVDIRRGSPQFGEWVALELSATAFNQIFVPAGFAHGFLTLEPETEVFYKVSAPYSAPHDRCIRWDDPDIGVAWGLKGVEPALSAKDRAAPPLRDVEPVFDFKEGGQ